MTITQKCRALQEIHYVEQLDEDKTDLEKEKLRVVSMI